MADTVLAGFEDTLAAFYSRNPELRTAGAKGTALVKKPVKEFSGEEIRDVLGVFREFDRNGDGSIDASELQELAAVLMIDLEMSEADTYTTNGKIDPKEFFAFYTGCTAVEAAQAFVAHAQQFDALKGKGSLKEYSEQEVTDVLAVFKQFDTNGDGSISSTELQELCAILMVEAPMEEADQFIQDGKIDSLEFFKWYTGCSLEETKQCFQQHSFIFDDANVGTK